MLAKPSRTLRTRSPSKLPSFSQSTKGSLTKVGGPFFFVPGEMLLRAAMKILLPLFLLVPLASCREDRPPAPTAEQSDQLNEAEELLNQAASAEE